MRRPGSEECNQAAPQGVLRTAPKEGRKRPPLRGHSPRPFGPRGECTYGNPAAPTHFGECSSEAVRDGRKGHRKRGRSAARGRRPAASTVAPADAVSGHCAPPVRVFPHSRSDASLTVRASRGGPSDTALEMGVVDTVPGGLWDHLRMVASRFRTRAPAWMPQSSRRIQRTRRNDPPQRCRSQALRTGTKKLSTGLVGRNRAVLPRCTSTTPDLTGTGLDTTRGARRWRSEIR
ncbi:hypothetical protein SAMN04490239_9299 [Rhodococcus koreensis]|uniref:Uncharacterized protein n=1 Tax=Rhodococcus koreensis TaxID=99653 RepID=A0A1H5ENF5_9NOCA|nr:hypothetical protein SAMN04490239_9299 [Rhodococcus koreensis]